jgi:outer membrane lipoprotein SlyB
METLRTTLEKRNGLLYPTLLIAAIAVIVFSAVGVATMTGVLPSALSQGGAPEAAATAAGKPGATAAAKPAEQRRRTAAAGCPDCGVIESIRAVESPGQGSALGAIGGALVGGVLGNQVGRGSGRTAATVVGAGAGAYAGHELEKNLSKSVRYQVRVRLEDGSVRTFHEAAPPAWTIGQKVRVTERGIVAAG